MRNKINKVKLNKRIANYLDNGDVDMLVMNEIEDLLEANAPIKNVTYLSEFGCRTYTD